MRGGRWWTRVTGILGGLAALACAAPNGPTGEWGDHRPVVSPDGATLAFMSNRSGTWSMYLMPLDGSAAPRRVSDDPRGEWYADWSPDGSQLTYYRSDDDLSFLRTYLVATDEERPLGPQDGARAGPRWAPDGRTLLYTCRGVGICAMTREGDDMGVAYGLDGGQHDPALSPDGRRIAFVDPLEDDAQDAFIMNVDGTDRVRVTDDPSRTYGLDWSPDGRYLAYNTEVGDNSDIYVYVVETGEHRRLTTDPAYEHLPRWAPDGSYLVFTSDRTGAERIYRIAPDGSGLSMIHTESEDRTGSRLAPEQGRVLFAHVAVVDPVGGDVLPDRWVAVSGGTVAGVSVEEPSGWDAAVRISGSGLYLAPGLVDMHVHPSGREDLDALLVHAPPPAWPRARAPSCGGGTPWAAGTCVALAWWWARPGSGIVDPRAWVSRRPTSPRCAATCAA